MTDGVTFDGVIAVSDYIDPLFFIWGEQLSKHEILHIHRPRGR